MVSWRGWTVRRERANIRRMRDPADDLGIPEASTIDDAQRMPLCVLRAADGTWRAIRAGNCMLDGPLARRFETAADAREALVLAIPVTTTVDRLRREMSAAGLDDDMIDEAADMLADECDRLGCS